MITPDIPTTPLAVLPAEHAMGGSLERYVSTRVHEWVDENSYHEIVVVGQHDRTEASPSEKEKRDKLENWQRPTARRIDGTLEIRCYPGRAYVFHYASLIATHLLLTGRDPSRVRFRLPEPDDCRRELERAGFGSIPVAETALVASGSHLLMPGSSRRWQDHGSFLLLREHRLGGHVAALAVKHSFWGDIAYHLGRILAESGFGRILFVGKLGSLRAEDRPNHTLVTGESSMLSGTLHTWRSAFDRPSEVQPGRHVTVLSVLQETKAWLGEVEGSYDFVDPEIGNFAYGVTSAGGAFGYLHLVSDTLAARYHADLSNERDPEVRPDRLDAYRRLRELLLKVLA